MILKPRFTPGLFLDPSAIPVVPFPNYRIGTAH
ncbi:hypothetical protein L1278_003667 [Pontibacter sp. HSC-36F09]|nr:hypothetical protein [Pontibacter sp. HSC-36F09]